jgi:anti-anti-sigma regulatory factor
MAARNKKKDTQSQMSQETENTTMGALVMAAETAQEQFVVSDGDFNVDVDVDDTDNLSESVNNPEILEADSSEVDMDTNADLPKAQSPDEAVTDDAVEPVINLDATLSIQNVVKLYEMLKKSYAANDAIEIDASHVNSVDTATLQLFVALKKDALKQKKEVVFFQPSPRFIESARLLDLLEILDITSV